jgi:hypothetical protein
MVSFLHGFEGAGGGLDGAVEFPHEIWRDAPNPCADSNNALPVETVLPLAGLLGEICLAAIGHWNGIL